MCISGYMRTTFFYLGIFLKKSAEDQCSSITKGSIYHIKNMSIIQPFAMEVDWPEIGRLMEVSINVYYLHMLPFCFEVLSIPKEEYNAYRLLISIYLILSWEI